MRDPEEGLDASGMITTGVSRSRIARAFSPLVDRLADEFADRAGQLDAELMLYGSVATGQAVPGRSDLDLLASGLDPRAAEAWSRELEHEFPGLVRGVEFALIEPADLEGDAASAHGNRVFTWHYCLPLSGPGRLRRGGPYRGDREAARGFHGDLAMLVERWRADPPDPVRSARRTLLAVAGLHSIVKGAWTTDRATGAEEWARHRPGIAEDLAMMLAWAEGRISPLDREAARLLAPGGTLDGIVDDVEEIIGLWS